MTQISCHTLLDFGPDTNSNLAALVLVIEFLDQGLYRTDHIFRSCIYDSIEASHGFGGYRASFWIILVEYTQEIILGLPTLDPQPAPGFPQKPGDETWLLVAGVVQQTSLLL